MSQDQPALVIHGHFYQPPRENPWTGMLDREPSARPFHDWNERTYRECYRPNAFSRILDGSNRVERLVNNYAYLSFNFGPTLLSWFELRHPRTYQRILQADRDSVQRCGGHGAAIAQGYNHAILPLCTERDRRTQVRWGLADFRHRFQREPESLWLPETACNDDTLSTLIEEGLKFVILSPYQAERVRPLGPGGPAADQPWRSVADGDIDPSVAYRYFHRDGSGRSIALFFYDGPIARAIAFEGALTSSQTLIQRFAQACRQPGHIVHVATDGETYGHHFAMGDRCLSYALTVEAQKNGFWVTNYGEYLEHHPPVHEVEIKPGPGGEGTAWSCAHGVGRWYRDCGCQTGGQEGWNQGWRGPLREALDFLRDEAAKHFEGAGAELFTDPWSARDEYIDLVLSHHRTREDFLKRHAIRPLREAEQVRAMTFLEMQRNALLMYTSCGWFFTELSGIETIQVMKYAGRVLDCLEELDILPPTEDFLGRLGKAQSNLAEMGNGADIFRRLVLPSRVPAPGVAAHLAISALPRDMEDKGEIAGYAYRRTEFRREQQGRVGLLTGRLALEQIATGRLFDFATAAIHFGGIDFYCVMRPFAGMGRFKEASEALWNVFHGASLPRLLRVAAAEFGPEEYGLEHLLPDGRERIAETVYRNLLSSMTEQYARLYEDNRRLIEMLQEAGFELPAELRAAAEFTLSRRFEQEVERQQRSQNPEAYQRALEIAAEVARRGYHIDRSAAQGIFADMLDFTTRYALDNLTPESVDSVSALLGLVRRLGVQPILTQAQESVYGALQVEAEVTEPLRKLALVVGLAPSLTERTGKVEPQKPEQKIAQAAAA